MTESRSETRRSRVLRYLIEFVLLCSIVFFVVKTVIGFLAPQSLWGQDQNTYEAVQTQRISQSRVGFDFTTDPFHRDRPKQSQDIGSDAPETTLSLKLFGRRTTGENGSAVLETPDRTQGVYKVGDVIISGVTLKSVHPDYIVLSRNGILERLGYERNSETLLPKSDAQTETETKRSTTSENSNPIQSSNSGLPLGLSDLSPKDLISALSFDQVRGPGKAGRVKGFQVRSKTGAIVLADFGLQDGDIITAVGDADLTQGRPDVSTLYNQLNGSTSVKLKILRGNSTLVLNVGRP